MRERSRGNFLTLAVSKRSKRKRDLENEVRGLLKDLGLVIGRAKMNTFSVRVSELIEDRQELAAVIEPLLKARVAVAQQIADLDRKVMPVGT